MNMKFINYGGLFCLLLLISHLQEVKAKPPAIIQMRDSILDNGNRAIVELGSPTRLPPYGRDLPPGVTGDRYSNGLLIGDFLAQDMGLPLPIPFVAIKDQLVGNAASSVNFAFAGSGLWNSIGMEGTSLGAQVEKFKSHVVPALQEQLMYNVSAVYDHLARSIVYIMTRNNDMTTRSSFEGFMGLSRSEEEHATFIENTSKLLLDELLSQIQILYSIGMRRFILPELFAIGFSPAIDLGPEWTVAVNNFASKFNTGLGHLIKDLFHKPTSTDTGRPLLHGAAVMHPKVYELSSQIASKPLDFGYNGKGPCFTEDVKPTCLDADLYIWFDKFHPCQRFYETMASKIWNGDDEQEQQNWLPRNRIEFLEHTITFDLEE